MRMLILLSAAAMSATKTRNNYRGFIGLKRKLGMGYMKTGIMIIALIFGVASCTPPKYVVKTDTGLSNMDLDRSLVNYIPILDSDLASSVILSSTYSLLEMRKYEKLSRYLETVQSDSSDYYLAKALYHISRTEYQQAVGCLNKIDDSSYHILKELLSIDVAYELSRLGGSANYRQFLQDYQLLIDNHPGNEQLKKIVSVRIRYIRYNY
jgi:hypothetical protein